MKRSLSVFLVFSILGWMIPSLEGMPSSELLLPSGETAVLEIEPMQAALAAIRSDYSAQLAVVLDLAAIATGVGAHGCTGSGQRREDRSRPKYTDILQSWSQCRQTFQFKALFLVKGIGALVSCVSNMQFDPLRLAGFLIFFCLFRHKILKFSSFRPRSDVEDAAITNTIEVCYKPLLVFNVPCLSR